MIFLVDAQLTAALARMLTSKGHEAAHVADINLRDADDASIWNYAQQRQAIIITKDEDFPLRSSQSTAPPVIIWLRIGNTSRKAIHEKFDFLLPDIMKHVEKGDRLIEVR
jgi:predicted nuclease of predicted toxin-antitoxin system